MSDGDVPKPPGDPDRLERALSRLGEDYEPPAGWEQRVFDAIATERIASSLARLGEEHEPPAGWQARVLAASAQREPWWRKLVSWQVAIPSAALVATVVAVLMVVPAPSPDPLEVASPGGSASPPSPGVGPPREWPGADSPQSSPGAVPTKPEQLALTTNFIPRDPAKKMKSGNIEPCDAAVPDDSVKITATGGTLPRAVWVYRKNKLESVCPGDLSCNIWDPKMTVDVPLKLIGEYRIIVMNWDLFTLPPTNYDDAAPWLAKRIVANANCNVQ